MANWNLPTATSGYLDFVTEMNTKFVDIATLFNSSPTNPPNNSIRYNRSLNNFQEYIDGTWFDKYLSIYGGGTGAYNAAGARANLGIGSMGTQNSNAVAITGGSISGVNLDAGSITGGIVALSRGGTGVSLAIAGLGAILISDGSKLIWDGGQGIASLDASKLVTGTVPDARLSANIPNINLNNSWNQQNIFNGKVILAAPAGSASVTISSTSPRINFYETDMGVDGRYKIINIDGGAFYFQAVNDAYDAVLGVYFTINSTGIVVGTGGVGAIYGSGIGITNLNASNITSGIVPIINLGAGGARDSTTFLRGDNVWAVPAGGSGGTAIPSGMVAMFDTNCPVGWTRFSQMDNKFPLGYPSAGVVGGSNTHAHGLDVRTDGNGNHSHSVDVTGSGSGSGSVNGNTAGPNATVQINYDAGTSTLTFARDHFHAFGAPFNVNVNVSASGNTNVTGNHDHRVLATTSVESNTPAFYSLVFCRKD